MFRRCVVHLVPRAPLHAVTGAPFVGQLSQLLSAAATEHNYRSCLWVPVDLLRQIDRFECEGGTADPAGTISNKAESPIGNGNGNAAESAPPQSHGEMNTKQMKQKKKSKATQKELSPKQVAAAETRSPTSASPESEFKVLLRRGATVTPGYAVNSFQLRNMQKQHQVTQTVLNNSAADNNSSALFREKNFVQFVNMDDVCLPHNVDVRSLFHHHFTQPHRFSRRQRDSGQEAAAVAGHLLGMEESFHVGAAAAPMPWHFRNVVGGGFSADVCALLVQAHVQQNYKSLNWVEESELALLGWSVKQNATVVEVPPQMFKKKTRTPMLSSSSVSSSAAPSELQFSDPSDRSKKYYNIEDVVDAVSFNEFFLRDRRVIKVVRVFCGGRAGSKGGAVDDASSNKISNSTFPDSSTSPFRAKFYPPLMTLEWQVHLSTKEPDLGKLGNRA
ncbi:Hypothetical protein, putative [Bodo saltans]|uniref:Uncharacterized protein n=1 Tax=Bodo saltans TaxID=75058 RepID=A0A0S4JHA9_BODSA|nr:Hypothetical protein, putative [Bodo saltans]|eukprot:CUG88398.1 Hypothetical protein, putative [Bodo saltans]